VPIQPSSAPPAFVSHSPETGSDYAIYVGTPDPARDPGPWTAVLAMDGDYLFEPAAAAARELQAAGAVPGLLVVGVGYGAGFGKPGNHRGRDYTPTPSSLEPSSGGADRFLAYLSGTLWSDLARRYPIREDRRLLAGHSLGSLLVLHAILQPSPFFNRALASAPSLWWDDRSLLVLASRLRDRQSDLPVRLFLGVGEDDTPSMTGDLALFEKLLAERPFGGLQVLSVRLPGRDHHTVVPDVLRAGLRALLS